MIIYMKCLCKSSDRLLAKKFRELYAAEIRVVNNNRIWRTEAASYKMKLPFIVENGVAKPL